MPAYDYRCRACGDTFELSRPMAQADAPAPCPQGHLDSVKLLTTFGVVRGAAAAAPPAGGGGGCCGGGCCR